MFTWLSKWLRGLFVDESGFILNPVSPFFRDEGDGVSEPGEGVDSGEVEPEEGEVVADDPYAGFDDDKVIGYLKDKKGIDVDLAKLPGQSKALGDLTTAHDSTVKAQKAVRLALEKQGINYDSVLAQGMDMAAGIDSNVSTPTGFTGREPEHFRDFEPDELKVIEQTADYHFERQMSVAMPKIIEGLLKAIDDRDLDKEEKSYEESNEDYAKHKEAVKAYREKHGITSRSKETREWILNQVISDTANAVKGLAGNEDKAIKKNLRGAPPPGGGNRQPGNKGLTAIDKHRKKWEAAHR